MDDPWTYEHREFEAQARFEGRQREAEEADQAARNEAHFRCQWPEDCDGTENDDGRWVCPTCSVGRP